MGTFPHPLTARGLADGRRAAVRVASGLAAALLVCLGAGAAPAQEPVPVPTPTDTVPADTLPSDTLRVRIPPSELSPDTLPADSLIRQDTLPVPPFPRFPDSLPVGWAYQRWQWDRDQLLGLQALSLLQLLQQVPGLGIVRSGDLGAPAAVGVPGLGGGRVRVLVDGFELDPLGFGQLDLQQIGLVDLESVRVSRDPWGTRIELNTQRLEGNRPFSVVEAATGVYEAKFLRAALMRGIGRRSIVAAGYDLVSTDGFGFRAPFSLARARASWSYAVSEQTGVRLEFHTTGVDRADEAFPEAAARRALLLQGRSELRPGLVVDALLARSWRVPEENDLYTESLGSTQAMVRAGWQLPRGGVEGALRLRTGAFRAVPVPALELSARGALLPTSWLGAEAQVLADVGGGAVSGTARLGAATGPFGFATAAAGERALALLGDPRPLEAAPPADSGAVVQRLARFTRVSGGLGALRAGAGWATGSSTLGVAAVALASGVVTPFGVPFDLGLPAVDAQPAAGYEAYASAPVPGTRGAVRLDGWYTLWPQRGGRPYLASDEGYAAATFRTLAYDGQLAPMLRVELVRRGESLGPAPGAAAFGGTTTPYTLLNLFLQIRIVDVQAFGLWENFLNFRSGEDVPGRRLPGQRLVYGIRWVFRD